MRQVIIRIQKMPTIPPGYFRYFTAGQTARAWGLALTASGFTRIAPGSDYPPVRHPDDHHFDWSQGRTLDALQLVLITAGRGHFETRSQRRTIEAGEAFVLLPGIWHRYRPDPDTGWEESWLEVTGPQIASLRRAGVLSPRHLVRSGGIEGGLEQALAHVHELARNQGPDSEPELSAAAYRVLAAWNQLRAPRSTPSRLQGAVLAAQQHFADHLAEPVNVAALARQLGVAYSHFRRAFKTHTGYAPWQYVLQLRLAHARRALATGDTTLEEIAMRFGFSSAFHFSAAFKRAQGVAPDHWRKQLRG